MSWVQIPSPQPTWISGEMVATSFRAKRSEVLVWKKISFVDGNYEVSACGKIRNGSTRKTLSLNVASGYLGVVVKPNGRAGKSVFLKVHRCVAFEFVDGYFDGAVVNHKDGNKLNNVAENLEWTTQKENMRHAVSTGLLVAKRGIESPLTKLTREQVLEIKLDGRSSRVIAEQYGVSKDTVLDVKTGNRYKDIT